MSGRTIVLEGRGSQYFYLRYISDGLLHCAHAAHPLEGVPLREEDGDLLEKPADFPAGGEEPAVQEQHTVQL